MTTIRDRLYEKALNGQAYFVSSGMVTNTNVTGFFRSTLTNPAGNTKTVVLYRLEMWLAAQAGSGATGFQFGSFYINPTAGLPTSTARNVVIANPNPGLPSAVVYKADFNATALSGGTDLQFGFGVPTSGAMLDIEPSIFYVGPGVTVGFNVKMTATTQFAQNWYWFEE